MTLLFTPHLRLQKGFYGADLGDHLPHLPLRLHLVLPLHFGKFLIVLQDLLWSFALLRIHGLADSGSPTALRCLQEPSGVIFER